MRFFKILVGVVPSLVVACGRSTPVPSDPGWTDPETGIRLVVRAVDKHPHLRDHGRDLVVVAPTENVCAVRLYSDAGNGAWSNLYRAPDGGLVIVDLNGTWILIDKSGDITSTEWRWDAQLPPLFLGSLRLDDNLVYRLLPGEEPAIYRFKDPQVPQVRR